MALVLKTGIVFNKELSRVRIPLSPFADACFPYLSGVECLFSMLNGNGPAISVSRARNLKMDLSFFLLYISFLFYIRNFESILFFF